MVSLMSRIWLVGALVAACVATAAQAQTPTPTGPVELQNLPSCGDAGGQHLNYNAATGTFSCGTTAGALPAPTPTTLGGVQSLTPAAHQFVNGISTSGVPSTAQPAAADVSGLAASATTDTTNASNISSGTLPYQRLPAPTSSTPGGVASVAQQPHEWVSYIDTSGVPHLGQPALGDISGAGALAALGVGSGLTPSNGLLNANVTTVFGRSGAVTLMSGDVTAALGFVPLNAAGGVIGGNLGVQGTVNGSLNINGIAAGPRSPQLNDDSSVPFADGATWQDSLGRVYQAQDNTAGYAEWQEVESAILPLDVALTNISNATYTSGGGSCVANEVLTFTGGMQITTLTCTGGSPNVPATWSITQPRMHACPVSPSSISPLATTGGDGSSVWNLTPQYAIGYSTRLLTQTYTGSALEIQRSDTGEVKNIGFQSDGSLDEKTLDGFTSGGAPIAQYATYSAGVNPRLAIVYNQGCGGQTNLEATQTAVQADQPVMFPGRRLGNARSWMFDARTASASDWDPTTVTFLSLGTAVAVTGNNYTVAVLAGVVSNNAGAYLLHLGAQGSLPLIYLNAGGGTGTAGTQLQDNSSTKINGPGMPDEATLYLGSSNSTTTTFCVGNVCNTGSAGTSSTVSGGTLGELWNGSISAPADESMVLIFPWTLSATEDAELEESVAETFKTYPQKRGVVVALGDSHMEAWGYPYQQDLLRQTAAQLDRPDISFVNTALTGADLSSFVGSNILPNVVEPTLAAYSGNKFVLIEGGYNDRSAGQTVAQIEATYTSLSSTMHSYGAKVICDTDVIRNASLAVNDDIQTIAGWMGGAASQGTPPVCDYVLNLQAYAAFDAVSGPWGAKWFEQQDGELHLNAGGNHLAAGMTAADLQDWFGF